MTLSEFVIWFDGFTANKSELCDKDLATLSAKIKELGGGSGYYPDWTKPYQPFCDPPYKVT